MCRRIARAILAAAAAGATVAAFGLAAAGSAGAATGPAPVAYHPRVARTAGTVLVSNQIAGYVTAFSNAWRFRSVATTVPVAPCQVNPNVNPGAVVELVGGTVWAAQIEVFCNGGAGSIIYFDQKSATRHVQGTFQLAPSTGGLLRIAISRNVAAHVDSFTVTNLRTHRSQTVRVTTSTAVVYNHAFLGSGVPSNLPLLPLLTTVKLLWAFQATRVVTYGGSGGTLRGPWATVQVIDRTSGGRLVMYPGALPASGAAFSTFLNHA